MPLKDRKARAAYCAQYAKTHREQMRAYHRKWRNENPEKNRESRRREFINGTRRKWALRKFGLTLEMWEKKFDKQGRRCAICRSDKSRGKHGLFCLDHCHRTKNTRDILCSPCNLMLGHAKDSITTLKAAIKYLERHIASGSKGARVK